MMVKYHTITSTTGFEQTQTFCVQSFFVFDPHVEVLFETKSGFISVSSMRTMSVVVGNFLQNLNSKWSIAAMNFQIGLVTKQHPDS